MDTCDTKSCVMAIERFIFRTNYSELGAKIELLSKTVSGIILAILFVSVLTLAFNIEPVEASGTIYIRADGSVEGTTNIVTDDNVTYTLNDSINDSIVVERSNIIIDGAGYAVQCSGTGFYLSGINNVTIKNTNIKNSQYGIWLYSSSNNTISNNNITANNHDGIMLDSSSNNTISNNNITNNDHGIGLYFSSNYNRVFHNNFINNTHQVYSSGSVNIWDDGYPSGGNYWSDYNGTDVYSGFYQNETSFDWIGDSPYVIDKNNQDKYPLTYPFAQETEEFRIAYRNLLLKYSLLRSDLETLNSTYYELLGAYDWLISQFESLNSTYYELFDSYNELLTNFNTLNATYKQHILDYYELQENYTSLQNSYENLLADFDVLNMSYNSLNSSYYNLHSYCEWLNSSYTNLQTDYSLLNSSYINLNTTFNEYKESIQNELNYITNLMYIFITATVILVTTTVYFAVRKPKSKS
jgi:parallel beta-helix repeat protein